MFSALSTMIEQTFKHHFLDMKSSLNRQLSIQTHSNNLSKKSFVNKNASSRKRDLYILWHRRINHLKSAKLRNLHKITTLKTLVFIIERNSSCEVCAFIKMINKRNHQLIKRKFHILTLMFIDICDSFFFSHFDHEYFLEIVNNHFRRTWHIFLRKRSNASETFYKWKLMIELQSEIKLQAICNDNVKEFKFILNKWCEFIDIVSKYIVIYNFF